MANTYKPDSKVAMETRKFQSEFGYSRDISNDDIPAANKYMVIENFFRLISKFIFIATHIYN